MPQPHDDPLLDVQNLRTTFRIEEGVVTAVDGISYRVGAGEVLGIVGESGSGKSVGVLSLLRLLPSPPATIAGDSVRFKGRNLLGLSEEEMRHVRGNEIAMIFQEPLTSLNPVFSIGNQIDEGLVLHEGISKRLARERTIDLLRAVGIPNPERRADAFPHQLSGGMRQRAMIAMALACSPDLLIADEPTTALDVSIQAQILELLRGLQRRTETAMLFITHDLGVVAEMCDRVAVMYAGKIVEEADTRTLFRNPAHPYTWGLFECLPRISEPKGTRLTPITGSPPNLLRPPRGCAFAPRCPKAFDRCRVDAPPLFALPAGQTARCWLYDGSAVAGDGGRAESSVGTEVAPIRIDFGPKRMAIEGTPAAATDHSATPAVTARPDDLIVVRDLQKYFPITKGVFRRHAGDVQAVDGISFGIKRGETLGLVGESGCGKSTTGRLLLRLIEPTAGSVTFDGRDVTGMGRGELRTIRRRMQIIFQDPYSSLNPRRTSGSIIAQPIEIHGIAKGRAARERAQEIMDLVGLNPRHANSYPHEYSGGQRQRIGIARAIAANPDFIVADEPVSALDVSIQAQIVNLMQDLQARMGLSYLFISHNLSVVRSMCDRVAVMYLGKIVELAANRELYESPLHPYTMALLTAVPSPDPGGGGSRIVLPGDVPSPLNPPSGCRFHTRCPYVFDRCRSEVPLLADAGNGHLVACHLYPEDGRTSIAGHESAAD